MTRDHNQLLLDLETIDLGFDPDKLYITAADRERLEGVREIFPSAVDTFFKAHDPDNIVTVDEGDLRLGLQERHDEQETTRRRSQEPHRQRSIRRTEPLKLRATGRAALVGDTVVEPHKVGQ